MRYRSLSRAQQHRTLSFSDDEGDDTDCAPGFAMSDAIALFKPSADEPKAKRPRLQACSPLLPLMAQPAALPLVAEPAALPLMAEAAALPLMVEAAALPTSVSAKRKSEDAMQQRASAPRAFKAPPSRKTVAAVVTAVVPRTLLECKVFLAPGLVPRSDCTFIQARSSKLGKLSDKWGPGFTHIVISFADKLKDDEGAKKRVLLKLRPWVLAAPQALVVAPTWLIASLKADYLLPFGPSHLFDCDSLAGKSAPAALPLEPALQFRRKLGNEVYFCQQHLRDSVLVVNGNLDIRDTFQEISDLYSVLGKAGVEDSDYFRARNFELAVKKIAKLDFPLNTPEDAYLARRDGLLVLGKSCFETLIEFLEDKQRCAAMQASGRTYERRLPQRLRMLYADPIVMGTRELCTIFGIGPSEARDLWAQGIRGLEDLRKRVAAGISGELPPLKLNECVLVGLPFHEDIQPRIPRAEVSVFLGVIQRIAQRLAPGVCVQAVGSFRRGSATSGDVDILVTHADDETGHEILKLLVKALLEAGVMSAELAGGSRKMEEIRRQEKDACGAWSHSFMGIGKLPELLAPPELPRPLLHRRIDIKVYAKTAEPFALLYFTGSERFNRSMRHFAKQLKPPLSLSDKGLVPSSDKRAGSMHANYSASSKADKEEDIFAALGLDYVPPEDRNDIDRVPFMKA